MESIDVTVIYGATDVPDRRELWSCLESLAIQCTDISWLVGGDFNAIRYLSEVCGTSGDIRMAMDEFNTCLQNTALLPLPMQGEWYTWHNKSTSPRNLWKRLDRMLTNDTWTVRFPNVIYTCLTPRTSDHSPMVIIGDNHQQHGGMFRFDNFITHSPDFISSVQSVWQHEIVGVPMFSITRKLKALKPIFREMKRKKGDLTHNVQLVKGFLGVAQTLVSANRQDQLWLLLEHCCRLVYAKAEKLEQIMLQQRAKIQWMKGGDQCSRIFFRKIARRRATRRILQITDAQGVTHTDPDAVTHEFISYYQTLLGGERRQQMMDFGYLRPWARHILTEEEVDHLIANFTADDVKNAVFDIGEDKAQGPNSFSSGFFKVAWHVVGQEVTRAVLDFFAIGRLLKQINSTLVTLIPKVHTPMSVVDFRPISCCTVLYKIITKLIVQRLSVVLDKLVSSCQSAFILGRSIGDNVMLAQELFSGYNQARLPPRCALKVDIRKAYDTVEWDFLLEALKLFSFPEVFRRWIEECVTSTSFSIGMNGKPNGFFKGARGLRQGDPLSPYLFVLVMEILHMGFLQLIDQDMNFTFHWKCEASRVFQLGFADDLILFCRADIDSIRVLKNGLDRFASWSGLRLKIEKSHLIISKLTISDCQPLLRKIDERINGWEGLALSYAGRVQLIKLVLMAFSVYWGSAFILPKGVLREIRKRFRSFLWKGTGNNGYAKVAWKDVCKPKEEGGLGLRDVGTLNRALMCKKLCEVIRCDRTSIWVD
ncbi:UNVERIFIED_CONTAM: putative mitochondrial protein [Sesamum indicum]